MKKLGRDILIVLTVVLLFRSCLYEPYRIPSGSMMPTLLRGDLVLVEKFAYGYTRYSFPFALIPFKGRIFDKLPTRGDVAVFRKPTAPDEPFVKRVVGMPGDEIQVARGRLLINGKPIKRERAEDFVFDAGDKQVAVPRYNEFFEDDGHEILEIFGDESTSDNTGVYRIPEGHVFMMGDNRDNSRDSRYIGPNDVGYVPLDNMIGPVRLVILSYDFTQSPWRWLRWGRFLHVVR